MYRVAAKISDDEMDDPGRPLLPIARWRARMLANDSLAPRRDEGAPVVAAAAGQVHRSADQTGRGENVMPLLCQEACNLLVAEARKVVKSHLRRSEAERKAFEGSVA